MVTATTSKMSRDGRRVNYPQELIERAEKTFVFSDDLRRRINSGDVYVAQLIRERISPFTSLELLKYFDEGRGEELEAEVRRRAEMELLARDFYEHAFYPPS